MSIRNQRAAVAPSSEEILIRLVRCLNPAEKDELVDRVRNNVTIDWQVRENARAMIRVLVKRILRKYGYPPDLEQRATELVLEQAEDLCKDWSTEN